jgi:IclR family acetate operon transcriptional repressor
MISLSESSSRPYQIAAVDRVVAVLACLEARSGLRLSEIARDVGLSEPTTLRYLANLVEHGLVERDAAGRYGLGLRLFQLGQRAVGQRDVRKVALPKLERLLERFEETVNLAVRRNDDLVIIDVLESHRSIRKGASIGEPDSWHCSALGKAILSRLPEGEARAILARRGTRRHTAHTLATVDDVLRDLERVRARGYSIDDEEAEVGLRCVAAPVCDRRGDPVYAISVSGPATRVAPDTVPDIGAEVVAAASAVSTALGYQGEPAVVGAAA